MQSKIEEQSDREETVGYDFRFVEAETAEVYKIPFDEHWYNMPLKTRTNMIAVRLARQFIDNLQAETA